MPRVAAVQFDVLLREPKPSSVQAPALDGLWRDSRTGVQKAWVQIWAWSRGARRKLGIH